MLPLLLRLFRAFFCDELAFRRWLRGGLFAFAGGGLAFAGQIAEVIDQPSALKTIKVISVVCGFIAGSIQSSAAKRVE
jgi:hypothetical protein